MFEKFTENAIKVIMVAQQEARALNHNFCGTEQILLGLLFEGTSSAKILNSLNLNLQNVRSEVEKIIGKGSGSELEIPFTSRAKELLENAYTEASILNQPITDLLLLLVLTQTDGVHLQVLKNLDIDVDKIKILTLENLKTKQNNLLVTPFSYILLTFILLCFSVVLLYDLVSTLKLTLVNIIAIFELIMLNIFIIQHISKLPINLFKFIKLFCLSLCVLFIIVLIFAIVICCMIMIGKYKYSG